MKWNISKNEIISLRTVIQLRVWRPSEYNCQLKIVEDAHVFFWIYLEPWSYYPLNFKWNLAVIVLTEVLIFLDRSIFWNMIRFASFWLSKWWQNKEAQHIFEFWSGPVRKTVTFSRLFRKTCRYIHPKQLLWKKTFS